MEQTTYRQLKISVLNDRTLSPNDKQHILFTAWRNYVRSEADKVKKAPSHGMIFFNQPTDRHEQIRIIVQKLSKRHKQETPQHLVTPASISDYISKHIWKFIRPDNTIRGFKTRCTLQA